jgi:hypothetical protein
MVRTFVHLDRTANFQVRDKTSHLGALRRLEHIRERTRAWRLNGDASVGDGDAMGGLNGDASIKED